MPELLFEIWRDEATNQQSMGPVSRQGDKVRRATMPNASLAHSFKAHSDFDAFQKNYDWNDWGRWKPDPDWIERLFTVDEVEEQRRYLEERKVF
jgi:hypothetical protein